MEQHVCTNGYYDMAITEEQSRTYDALRIAAERIGQNNYKSGLYYKSLEHKRPRHYPGYSVTEIHKQIIDAMPLVLSGAMSCNDAMAILWTYDARKQRYNK